MTVVVQFTIPILSKIIYNTMIRDICKLDIYLDITSLLATYRLQSWSQNEVRRKKTHCKTFMPVLLYAADDKKTGIYT